MSKFGWEQRWGCISVYKWSEGGTASQEKTNLSITLYWLKPTFLSTNFCQNKCRLMLFNFIIYDRSFVLSYSILVIHDPSSFFSARICELNVRNYHTIICKEHPIRGKLREIERRRKRRKLRRRRKGIKWKSDSGRRGSAGRERGAGRGEVYQ